MAAGHFLHPLKIFVHGGTKPLVGVYGGLVPGAPGAAGYQRLLGKHGAGFACVGLVGEVLGLALGGPEALGQLAVLVQGLAVGGGFGGGQFGSGQSLHLLGHGLGHHAVVGGNGRGFDLHQLRRGLGFGGRGRWRGRLVCLLHDVETAQAHQQHGRQPQRERPRAQPRGRGRLRRHVGEWRQLARRGSGRGHAPAAQLLAGSFNQAGLVQLGVVGEKLQLGISFLVVEVVEGIGHGGEGGWLGSGNISRGGLHPPARQSCRIKIQ